MLFDLREGGRGGGYALENFFFRIWVFTYSNRYMSQNWQRYGHFPKVSVIRIELAERTQKS